MIIVAVAISAAFSCVPIFFVQIISAASIASQLQPSTVRHFVPRVTTDVGIFIIIIGASACCASSRSRVTKSALQIPPSFLFGSDDLILVSRGKEKDENNKVDQRALRDENRRSRVRRMRRAIEVIQIVRKEKDAADEAQAAPQQGDSEHVNGRAHGDFAEGLPDGFEDEPEEEARQTVHEVRHGVDAGDDLHPVVVVDTEKIVARVRRIGFIFLPEQGGKSEEGKDGSDDQKKDAEREGRRADVDAARRVAAVVFLVIERVGLGAAVENRKRRTRRPQRETRAFGCAACRNVSHVDDPLQVEGQLKEEQTRRGDGGNDGLVQTRGTLIRAVEVDGIGD